MYFLEKKNDAYIAQIITYYPGKNFVFSARIIRLNL